MILADLEKPCHVFADPDHVPSYLAGFDLCFAKTLSHLNLLILRTDDRRLMSMLNAIVVSIRFILLILAGQKQVALENAALAPATGRVQTQRSAAKTHQSRSIILGRPARGLAGLEPRVQGELEKLGFKIFRTDGVALDAQKDGKAVADLDDVSSKSRRPNGLGRLLHPSPFLCRFPPLP